MDSKRTNLSLHAKRPSLRSFARALNLESHFLLYHPNLVWQQLCNRLQYADEQMSEWFASHSSRRRDRGEPPWIRMRTRFCESGALTRTLAGHIDAVERCAISPDGSFILSSSDDGALKVWDAADGRERFTLEEDLGKLSCAISPAGSFVVARTREGGLRVFDSASGGERFAIRDCSCWAIDCDDSLIAWFSDDGALHLRDLITGDSGFGVSGHSGKVSFCAFIPRTSLLLSVGCDKTIKEWDSRTGEQVRSFNIHAERVSRFCVSPDGSFVVVDGSGAIEFLDLRSGERRAKYDEDSWALALSISADSSSVIRLAHNVVTRWDAYGHETSRTFLGYQSIDTCEISADGSFVACANNDGTLTIRDSVTGAVRSTLPNEGVRACAISPDNSYIVTASGDRTLRIWDSAAINQQAAALESPNLAATAVAISPGGDLFVTGTASGALVVYETNGLQRALLESHEDAVNDVAFSRDGSFMVSASDDETVKVWDSGTGQERATLLGHYRKVNSCAVSADGSFIVSGSSNGLMKIWDAQQLEERTTIRTGSHIGACSISPDDSFIVTSHGDRTFRIWEVSSGSDIATLNVEGVTFDLLLAPTHALDISPDGGHLAAGVGASIVVWDARTRERVAVLSGHSDIVLSCTFTPNGSYIVSTSLDLTLRVWDIASATQVCIMGLPKSAAFVAAHPRLPMILFGSELYWADLKGLD